MEIKNISSIIPETVTVDVLDTSTYSSLIESPYKYKNDTVSNSYGVIGTVAFNAGTTEYQNTMLVEPVIPISYIGNKLYDAVSDSFNDILDASAFINKNNEYNEYISYAIANSKTDIFHYSNSIYSYNITDNGDYSNVDNSFIMKYEDITCRSKGQSNYITLDENTSIDEYIENIQSTGNINNTKYFLNKENYAGAFLYPDLDNISQIMTSGGERSSIVIKPGESISIPLTFEYFLPSTDSENSSDILNKISKKLVFAIKDSISSDGRYFELEVTGNRSSNFSDSIYTSIDNYTLEDSLTES